MPVLPQMCHISGLVLAMYWLAITGHVDSQLWQASEPHPICQYRQTTELIGKNALAQIRQPVVAQLRYSVWSVLAQIEKV